VAGIVNRHLREFAMRTRVACRAHGPGGDPPASARGRLWLVSYRTGLPAISRRERPGPRTYQVRTSRSAAGDGCSAGKAAVCCRRRAETGYRGIGAGHEHSPDHLRGRNRAHGHVGAVPAGPLGPELHPDRRNLPPGDQNGRRAIPGREPPSRFERLPRTCSPDDSSPGRGIAGASLSASKGE
jgi:hypothetical protein